MTAATVLREARKLVERGWTQGAAARTADGKSVGEDSPAATCWCSLGAMSKGSDDCDVYADAKGFLLMAVAASNIAKWNDALGRTQAEVVNAFSKAIELAEAEEAAR